MFLCCTWFHQMVFCVDTTGSIAYSHMHCEEEQRVYIADWRHTLYVVWMCTPTYNETKNHLHVFAFVWCAFVSYMCIHIQWMCMACMYMYILCILTVALVFIPYIHVHTHLCYSTFHVQASACCVHAGTVSYTLDRPRIHYFLGPHAYSFSLHTGDNTYMKTSTGSSAYKSSVLADALPRPATGKTLRGLHMCVYFFHMLGRRQGLSVHHLWLLYMRTQGQPLIYYGCITSVCTVSVLFPRKRNRA